MRNISFQLTTEQFGNRTKTVTRRLGWLKLTPGTQLMGCKKCMGLKPGEEIERLGVIRVKRVWRERLDAMCVPAVRRGDYSYGDLEAQREGFPNMSGEEFVEMFCRHMKCKPETEVTRIEFAYEDMTLEDFKRYPSLVEAWTGSQVHVWSVEYQQFWMVPAGYTPTKDRAGIFDFEDAWKAGEEMNLIYKPIAYEV